MLILAALFALLFSQSPASAELTTKHEPVAIEVQVKEPLKETIKMENN
jgi:hypothetical protein